MLLQHFSQKLSMQAVFHLFVFQLSFLVLYVDPWEYSLPYT